MSAKSSASGVSACTIKALRSAWNAAMRIVQVLSMTAPVHPMEIEGLSNGFQNKHAGTDRAHDNSIPTLQFWSTRL
jgi:hypothetical protein